LPEELHVVGVSARIALANGTKRNHFVVLSAALLWGGCSGSEPALGTAGGTGGSAAPDMAASDGHVHVRFDPGEGSVPVLGTTPWPDDLYLDRTGHINVSGSVESSISEDQIRMLNDLDGFGVSTPVYFYLDGMVDPSSLPHDEAASMEASASAFLIDADTGSPDAFTKVPVLVQWDSSAKRIALRPANGHPLTPGRRYAAVVTRRVKDRRGQQLEPAPKFASIKDPDLVLTDTRLMALRAQYTPVLETLVKSGLPRADISALAVFHVQNVDPDLVDARRLVRAGKAPVPSLDVVVLATDLDAQLGKATGSAGFDDSGAAPHDNLFAMVHGTLPSPNLLSATVKTHGKFERDATGQLRVKRTDQVPFTLFLPRSSLEAPIVIYQHQRDRERSDALAIANELAGRGLATLALDAPFQGMRANTPEKRKGPDWRNRFTGAETQDYFGDAPGDLLGFAKAESAGSAWNPFDGRDALRQAVVDLMVAVRTIEDGSLVVATSSKADLKERTFLRTHIGFVGEDVGASIGAMLARIEPSLQVVVLVAPPGASVTQWAWSARDEGMFSSIVSGLGFDLDSIDRSTDDPAFWPGYAVHQMLFDRADPLAHAAALRRAAVNVLVLMAEDDEIVPNRSTEGYAASLGTTLVGSDARYVGDLKRIDVSDDAGGNYVASGSRVTRSTYVYSPATHDFLQARLDSQLFEHPPEPPFERLSQKVTVQNPASAAARQIALYLESFFACVDVGRYLPTTACPATPYSP
jgi:hypothetical protein